MPRRTKEMLLCTEEPAKDEQVHSCSSRLQLGKTYKHERLHCAREGIDDACPPPSEDTKIIASDVILRHFEIERKAVRLARLS